MKRHKSMRNISRVEHVKKNQYGWFVPLMRDGRKFQKFFSDAVQGGERGALREAKRHRDDLVRQYPPSKRGNIFNRVTARNTSAHPGVSKSGSYRRGRFYEAWQAAWTLPNGKYVSKKFGFSPAGRTEIAAKRLAIKARRAGLESIETMEREMEAKRRKKMNEKQKNRF